MSAAGCARRCAAIWLAGVALFGVFTFSVIAQESIGDAAANAGRAPDTVLVRVNGQPVTAGDVQFLMITRQIPDALQPQVERRLLEQLIDQKLMQAYLAGRKAAPTKEEIDLHVERVHELIRRRGGDPAEVLAKIGFTDEMLRQSLALPLGWQRHFTRVVTDERIRNYYRDHREQFDGTELRASQILIKLPEEPKPEEVEAARKKLAALRERIVAGEINFADAAREHSESPSAREGGDVGRFAYRGRMPASFTRHVFGLQAGEVSEPFQSPFGMHLVQVTERHPGQFSLEDVRPTVLRELSSEMWEETVSELRQSARIEWVQME